MSNVRPVRNNNPCDIEATQPWRGLMPEGQMNQAQLLEPRFAVFISPAWGFRAAIVLLRNYWRFYQLNTVEKLAVRWAPKGENNTQAYISTVCKVTGFGPGEELDMENVHVLMALTKAFTIMESGQWEPAWTNGMLEQGAMLAGFSAEEVGGETAGASV